MDSLETVGWLMMSFIPSLLLMEIGCRIGKGKVVRKIKHFERKRPFASFTP